MNFARGFAFASVAAALALGCGESNRGKQRAKEMVAKETRTAATTLPPEIVEGVFRSLNIGPTPTDHADSLRQLNAYLASLGDQRPTLGAEAKACVQKHKLFDLATLDAAEFLGPDLDYAADVSTVAEAVASLKGGDDVATARRIFGWLVRRCQLSGEGELPPASPGLALWRGRGTAAERAWTFVEALRQVRVPAAVVEGLVDDPQAIFVAALVGDAAFLFAPSHGAPIPAADGAKIATVAEIAKNPELLKALGFNPKAKPEPKLLLPWEAVTASARIAAVQATLPTTLEARLHDDLASWRQVAEKCGTPAGVWPAPTEIRQRLSDRTTREKSYESLNRYWLSSEVNPYRLLLKGNPTKAASQFISYDFEKGSDKLEIELRPSGIGLDARSRLASRIRQDVVYFGGVAQIEKPQPGFAVAARWFGRYLAQFGSAQFMPESVLDPARLSMKLVQEGNDAKPTVGKRLWDAAGAGRKAIEAAAKDFGKLSSISGQQLSEFDDSLNKLLAAVEERAGNPQSDDDRKARKVDPRERQIDDLLNDVRRQISELPTMVTEKAVRKYSEQIGKRANDSLTQGDVLKEQAGMLKALIQSVMEAGVREADRAAAAKTLIVNLLQAAQKDARLATGEDVKPLVAGLPAAARARLTASDLPESERLALHRRLLVAGLASEAILDADSEALWIASAVRGTAFALQRDGKTAEALKTLADGHPSLRKRVELDAWHKLLTKYPKWVWD